MTHAPPASADIDEVRLLGGAARLRQARGGYRAGLDAALLAAAVAGDLAEGASGIEAGCGAGGALVQAALRAPGARLVGLERDPGAVRLADENVALNGLTARVSAQAGDVDAGFTASGLGRADVAFANPPYFDDPTALRPARSRPARRLDGGRRAGGVDRLPPGRRARRRRGHAGPSRRPARRPAVAAGREGGRPAGPSGPRLLRRPRKARARPLSPALARAPLRLLPPLVVHAPEGAPAPYAAALLRGEAALAWER